MGNSESDASQTGAAIRLNGAPPCVASFVQGSASLHPSLLPTQGIILVCFTQLFFLFLGLTSLTNVQKIFRSDLKVNALFLKLKIKKLRFLPVI